MPDFDLQALAALDAVTEAGERLAAATDAEISLADGRSIEKSFAIQRLMQTVNAETTKNHSASSAEKVVEADLEYMAYRRKERAAVVERIRAETALNVAKLRAQLVVGQAVFQ